MSDTQKPNPLLVLGAYTIAFVAVGGLAALWLSDAQDEVKKLDHPITGSESFWLLVKWPLIIGVPAFIIGIIINAAKMNRRPPPY